MATRRRIKAPGYLSHLFERVFDRVREKGTVTRGEVEEFQRQERARVGGMIRAERARNPVPALADTPNDDDSFQDAIREVRQAINAMYGDSSSVLSTFPTHVVYAIYPSDYEGGSATFYDQQYIENPDDNIVLGERKEVEKTTDWVASDGSDTDGEGDDDASEDSYEDLIEDVDDALHKQYGPNIYSLDTYAAYVVYCTYNSNGGTSTYYRQPYTGDDDKIVFGDRTPVERQVTWDGVAASDSEMVALMYSKTGASGSAKGGKAVLPANVTKLPDKVQQQWTDIWNSTYQRCTTGGGKDTDCEKQAFEAANGVIKRGVKAEDNDSYLAEAFGDTELADFMRLADGAKVSNKPWDGAASGFKDADAYCKACLIDDNAAGATKVQGKCHLPVYSPDGSLNLNAVRNAASRLNQVQASAASKSAAAKKLDSLKGKHGIGDVKHQDGGLADLQLVQSKIIPTGIPNPTDPNQTDAGLYQGTGASPDLFTAFAKTLASETLRTEWSRVYQHHHDQCTSRGGTNCDTAAGAMADAHMKSSPHMKTAPVAAAATGQGKLEDSNMSHTISAIRLADIAGGVIPEWQQIHKKGTWAVPHASGVKVMLTQAMGDQMIRNFHNNVVRRRVPLDEAHKTDQGGRALGWTEDIRWGSEGEGLLSDEPSGRGEILYARFRYTPVGQQMLADEEFAYFSPQYAFNYQDKESGKQYGYTLTAVAATNNPYLRLRSAQGEPAQEPVAVLSDGLVLSPQVRQERGPMTEEQTTTTLSEQDQAKLTDMSAKLAEFEARAERETKAREALETKLADSENQRHRDSVNAYLDAKIKEGFMPAAADIARVLLQNSSPATEATMKLSDEADAESINLHSGIRRLVELFPLVPVGEVLTGGSENRPGMTPAAALADQQVIQDYGRALLAEIGVGVGVAGKPEGGTASLDG